MTTQYVPGCDSGLLINQVLGQPARLLHVTSDPSIRRIVKSFVSAFPDATIEADWIVNCERRVVVGGRYRGSHLGHWRGVAPTGRTVSAATILSFEMERGLVADLTVVADSLSIAEQLGAVFPLSAPPCRRGGEGTMDTSEVGRDVA